MMPDSMMPARLPDFMPSEDAVARRRRGIAVGAAILIHVVAIALLLVKLPAAKNPVEKTIAVEIVPVAPPKPKPPEQVLPPPPPLPPSPEVPEPRRESGGESDRAPGKAAEKAPLPKPVPAPAPRPPKATPKQSLESLNIFPPAESSAAAVPFNPPPPPPKTEEAMVPPQPQPPPEPAPEAPPSPDPRRGEGGGDRYLNAVRDAILRRFTYPPEAIAEHVVGTARYEIVVDRQGNLISLHLLKSSGSGVLDTAGMTTIQQAAPFGPVPADVGGDQVGLLFIFHMGPGAAPAQ